MTKRLVLSPIACFILLLSLLAQTPPTTTPSHANTPLPIPAKGMFYHGVYPGGTTGEEDDLQPSDLKTYQDHVGQPAAWVYFSNNWYQSRTFPQATATWIRQNGSIPYIRLMLRSKDHKPGKPEKFFTLQAIIDGKFDTDLKAWGAAAGKFATPLMVEYGVEVNGDWMGWNGKYHGGGQTKGFGDPQIPDGPERFIAAYRHIIKTVREAGGRNITWLFHLDVSQSPEAAWNRFENYYPGDDWIDWIAVSCYGPQNPTDGKEEALSFRDKFSPIYPRIIQMAPKKPILIAEFGCTASYPYLQSHDWAAAALDDLLSNHWENVKGFSWWNERWENDDDPKHNTTMRMQDVPELAKVFRERLSKAKDHLATPPK